VTGPPAEGGVLDIAAQRDLVSQAHRQGITDLLVLAFIPDGRRLALFECDGQDGERQWTVPVTAVLPGELIEDALDRLCCQYLRVSPDRTEFLSATTTVRQGSEVVQYAFEVTLDQPRTLDGATSPGRHHWWSAEDPNTLPIATGIRPLLEAFTAWSGKLESVGAAPRGERRSDAEAGAGTKPTRRSRQVNGADCLLTTTASVGSRGAEPRLVADDGHQEAG